MSRGGQARTTRLCLGLLLCHLGIHIQYDFAFVFSHYVALTDLELTMETGLVLPPTAGIKGIHNFHPAFFFPAEI